MELKMNETSCRENRTLEVTSNGYKVVVYITTNQGKIESLSGNIASAKAKADEMPTRGASFNAYNGANGWHIECRAANEVYETMSAMAYAAVNYAVSAYER